MLVLGAITYLSVIVGELAPKHLALKNPEGIACAVAPLMRLISRGAGPVVRLLDPSARLIFRLFGQSTESAGAVTDEEIRTVVAGAETDERKMISGVMRLADRTARGIMTLRADVDWLDLDADGPAVKEALTRTRHSRLPACEGGPDGMIGVVQVRELLAPLLRGEDLQARARVRAAPVIPDTLGAPDALTVLREDGSWLPAGWLPADEMAEQPGITLPAKRDHETVAGLVVGGLRRLPGTGESVETLGWRFEVVDLDGRRIGKVLASRAGLAL